MRALLTVGAVLALPFLVHLFMSLMAAAARISRGGRSESRDFQRAGVNWYTLWHAKVRRQDSGSLISTRAGIRIGSSPDGIRVGETRTIAKDVF